MVFLRWLTANARGLRAPPSTTGRTRSRNCSSNSMSSRRRQRRFLPSNRLPKSRLPMLKSGCTVCSVVISSFNENSEFFGAPLRPCPAHCHRGHVIRASETDALRPAGCVPSMLIRGLTVFCQADFPIFVVGIPHRHRGEIPTFSGPCQEAGSTTASCRMRACSIR